jgi:anti-sigma factor RsiW
MKKTSLSSRDTRLLSAYLDGTLSETESKRLERRLARDRRLRSALDALRESRALLRRAPRRRAPRAFTLTPRMVAAKPPLPRALPWMQFASAAAAFLFLLTFIQLPASKTASMESVALRSQELPAAAPAMDSAEEAPPTEMPEKSENALPEAPSLAAVSPAPTSPALAEEPAETVPSPSAPAPPSKLAWARYLLLALAGILALSAYLLRRAASRKWLNKIR